MMLIIKKLLKIEQNKSEEEINKIIELNRIKKKLKERKENKIDYFDEVFRKNKKPIKRKSSSKTKENNDDTKDREEKLKIIKEKKVAEIIYCLYLIQNYFINEEKCRI